MTIEQVVANPAVGEALERMVSGDPRALRTALDDLKDMMRGEDGLEGYFLGEAVRTRKAAKLPIMLYEAFEAGSANLHLVAPAGFYEACARVFGVCPAKLSRGVVERARVMA
jgi:hypothetical protein